MSNVPTIEIWKHKNEWFGHLKYANNRITWYAYGYNTKANILRAIKQARRDFPTAKIVARR